MLDNPEKPDYLSSQAAQVLKSENHEYRINDWDASKKYWPIPQSEIDKDPALNQNDYK